MKTITEQMLDELREDVMQKTSLKRFRHTVAVEAMTARLCALFCPDKTLLMRAAALLHDITKELDTEAQISLCERYGLPVSDLDRISPKTFHARTAAAVIEHEYPAFADTEVVSAVRWHTTGRADMTLTDQLIYLADYIDESRIFENCVILRRYFWGAEPERMSAAQREALLRDTLILSFDMTVRDLLDEGKTVAEETMQARNTLLLQRERAR